MKTVLSFLMDQNISADRAVSRYGVDYTLLSRYPFYLLIRSDTTDSNHSHRKGQTHASHNVSLLDHLTSDWVCSLTSSRRAYVPLLTHYYNVRFVHHLSCMV